METARLGEQLVGRRRERDVLERLLEAAGEGRGGVLAVYGDPGVGKTALLEHAVRAARGFRVARAVGVEAEMELAYAALQQLCAPSLDVMDRLPDPQREALAVALGLSAGRPPDTFLVGLAVLGLLSEAADEQPLLCVVDDADWLDRASAHVLAFVARRLLAEKIAMVLATRRRSEALEGLPVLHVEPLGHRDARSLLESALPARLDERVLERIVVETHGNPLALLELPRGLTPAQLAGGFGLPAALPLSAQIEASFTGRLARMPQQARRLLLVAAADSTGDPALVWRAATLLGIPESAALTVESDDLVAFGDGVVFRHPLVRSAVYQTATPEDRSDVHRALAEATDPEVDPDRRAWHRARATFVPDEDVARELERSAVRALARGGVAAAAAFLERAAALTPDARRRAGALAAAQAKQEAGAVDEALALIADAEVGPLDDLQRAQVSVLRARISFAADRGREAPRLFLTAAKRLAALDVPLARDMYLDALVAAVFAGRLAAGCDAQDVAIAARAAPPSPSPPRAADLLLDGLAVLVLEGHAAATPALRTALSAFDSDQIGTDEGLRWRWLAGRTAGFIWDYETWDSLTERHVRAAREVGALGHLPLALTTRVGVHLFAGELQAAALLVEQSEALAAATYGRIVPPFGALALAAFHGREDELTRLVRTSTEDFGARGEGVGLTVAKWVTAVLNNGLARYDEAFAAAVDAAADPHEMWFSSFALVELIEAASRSGRADRAAEALEVLCESTRATNTPWGLGVEARSSALLTDGAAAEDLYRAAIDHLHSTRLRMDLARSHLLYGEWLRRQRRRREAREQLRVAHDLFADFGMEAFVARAAVELEATGEHTRRRTLDGRDQLTPQEAEISRLVARGNSNREIAAQLFISSSTVEYHLRKVFRKLDVKSRTQLTRKMT